MKTSIFGTTAAFWYQKFYLAMCEKEFALAEEYFFRHKYWERRLKLDQMLSELCQQMEKGAQWKTN